ncbi:hypothetical protein [Phytomonospora endophytica]|uniref:Peptidoglycan hydrolase-like protein with peptidoglycan-binding domain n=1 Tax=Phytomonospora endophytica TaxID=714109 RepID=A0A841FP55_9ACTN|nr:hypothetical protein [Phytomonospora endophytica]MBB6036643.1 peptidoglycan hydrolase-like protein with peptidoglycan-binding domain [Phytomonospora endophytica]GIG65964.1 hypothetical protein Pen01_22590 [Phytomonospora endophytica]
MKIAVTRSRVIIALLSLGLVVSSGVAVWAGSQARTPAQVSSEADAPEPSTVTATVQEGPLAASRKFTGELGREVALSVKAPATGSENGGGGAEQIVTFLPRESGDEVKNGQSLIEISGRPMIALQGRFPAFRDIKEGDKGRDVSQLQQALSSLYGTPVTGTFDARTTADVKRLYSALGYQPSTVDGEATVGEDGETTPGPKLVSVPAAELLIVKSLPATVGKVSAQVGLPAKDTLLTLVGGAWQVTVPLADGTKGLDSLDEDARLTFGDGPLEDKSTSLLGIGPPPGQEEQSEENDEGGDPWGNGEDNGPSDVATFKVNPKDLPKKPKVGLAQEVVVEFKHSPPEAVVVPVSALWRKAGTDVVTVVDAAGNRTDVPVTIHLNHEGLAAVTAKEGELAVGAKVVVAERSKK